MVRRIIITALPVLGILCSCQSEMIQEDTPSGRVLTVKATLPGADETRTHVTYGNQSVDYEFFRWDTTPEHGGNSTRNDYITLFNVSKFEQNPELGTKFEVTKVDGRSATFTSDNSSVEIKSGDILLVNYWAAGRNLQRYQDKNVFYLLGVGSVNSQPIVNNPKAADYMSFMQGNLRMYDIVTVEQDGVIPDLHFKWLSGLIRVSVRNETDEILPPATMEVEYPGTKSFINVPNYPLYCSVTDSGELITYDIGEARELFGGVYADNIYTDKIDCGFYCGPGDDGERVSIGKGATYDLYLPFFPRINNTAKGTQGLNINIVFAEQPYSINIKDFDIAVEAGKRYWFNLTAVKDADGSRLMLTSEWLDKQHSGQN